MAECSSSFFEKLTENCKANSIIMQYGCHDCTYYFVDPIHPRFICTICHNLIKDPSLMVCCGMKYCASCLDKWFKRKGSHSCPHCRSLNNYVIDKEMKKEIESFRILCPNYHKGCDWIGELREDTVLKNHIEICKEDSVNMIARDPIYGNSCDAPEQSNVVKSSPKTVATFPYGEHEYDFAEPIHERFICSICMKVIKDPHLLVCCGHKCCTVCLENWAIQSPSGCPYCQLSGEHVVEKGMKSEIESFKILCPYQYNGCEWIGELRNLQDHWELKNGCDYSENKCLHCDKIFTTKNFSKHESVCEKAPVDCPNSCGESQILRCELNLHKRKCKFEILSCENGCTKIIERQDMENHLENKCELRPQRCSYCDFTCTAREYSAHEKDCKMFPIECPNGCGGKGIDRSNLSSHRNVCELELVACDHKMSGCKARVRRQEMEHHIDHCCKLTPKQCEYCGKKTNAKDYSSHTQHCMKFPKDCPNLCMETGILRETLNSHRNKCKFELIRCSHINGSCSEMVKRQDMDHHLRNACRKTKTECPYCGSTYSENCFPEHEAKCEKMLKDHPNSSVKKVVKHQKVQNHPNKRN